MNEKIFWTAVSLMCEVVAGMTPAEAQVQGEACERGWAAHEQLRELRVRRVDVDLHGWPGEGA